MPSPEAEIFPHRTKLSLLLLLLLCGLAFAQAPSPSGAQPSATTSSAASQDKSPLDPLPPETGSAGLKLGLRKLQNSGRLMMVVAHPDDEDGGLLTLEARGKGVQTLLMTLTRGEGGQNKVGSSLFDVLGVVRTLELLAADRYYGVEQRFSHVADFGYSKTPEETFQKWGGHDVPLADIVRVIRTFRPDVLIARFSGTDRDGHGHHQASSILTQEAFRAAGDPKRFPEQIQEGLEPWQPKKLYIGNICGFMASTCADENWTVKLNTGEEDSVLGMPYFQFALEGLRHQQSQGLADIRIPNGPRYAFYKLADSVLPNTKDSSGHEKDIFDGIDTSLPAIASRLGNDEPSASWLKSGLKKVAADIGDSPASLAKAVAQLDDISDRMEQSELSPAARAQVADLIHAKQEEAAHALNLALNLNLTASVYYPQGPEAALPSQKEALLDASPGQKFQVYAKLHNGSKYWLNMRGAELEPSRGWVKREHAETITISPGDDYYATFLLQVPDDARITRPYWHRDDPEKEPVNQIDPEYQTLALPPSGLRVTFRYELAEHKGMHSPLPEGIAGHALKHPSGVNGGWITTRVEVPFRSDDGNPGKLLLAVTPAFSVELEPGEQIIPLSDGASTDVKIGVSSNLTNAPSGKLHLQLPSGWRAEPSELEVNLKKRGDQQDFSFKVYPAKSGEGRSEIRAVLDAGGKQYSEGYTLVARPDLGSFYYFQPAVQHVSIVNVKLPKDLRVAYIMGAGDDIPTVLQQIGMNLTLLTADKIASADLSQFGTIVLGVRAYDTQKELVANNKKLLDYVSAGGTLIVQNNNSTGDFNSAHLTPYPAELSRARVSVEEAPVQILDPGNRILHSPNEISQKDFDGWVQERGLYFMDHWDDHFKPLLSCHDPGEPDQKGGLLVAQYGKGTYIYTGYAFFRQLPAGVPGAIRLFVNLIGAGHE